MQTQINNVTIIAAVDDFYGIGLNGGLPWHNPRDLAFFKRTTENNVIVMGRKTWDSLLNRPLLNRENYILSNVAGVWGVVSDTTFSHTYWSSNILDVLNDCFSMWNHKKIYIIGGRQVYESALQLGIVDEVILSHIHGVYNCDTYFPPLKNTDKYCWKKTDRSNFKDMTRIIYKKHYV